MEHEGNDKVSYRWVRRAKLNSQAPTFTGHLTCQELCKLGPIMHVCSAFAVYALIASDYNLAALIEIIKWLKVSPQQTHPLLAVANRHAQPEGHCRMAATPNHRGEGRRNRVL